MKVFFLIDTDDYTIKLIMIFTDVIHVSIPDMYSFTAYKELFAIMWVKSYLPNAPFYIKTEDDVIIKLMRLLSNRYLNLI